jgi:hypothetical protein
MSQQPIQSDALGALRVQIDALDKQLLSLLNQRGLIRIGLNANNVRLIINIILFDLLQLFCKGDTRRVLF